MSYLLKNTMARHSSSWFIIYLGCLASYALSNSNIPNDVASSYFSSGEFRSKVRMSELPESRMRDKENSKSSPSPGSKTFKMDKSSFVESVKVWTTDATVSGSKPASPETKDMICLGCRTLVRELIDLLADGETIEEVEQTFIQECIVLELFPRDVCEGMVRIVGEHFIYVANHTSYNPNDICGFALGFDLCKGYKGLANWTVDLPPGKPEIEHPEPQAPSSPLRILHLSDLHADLEYTVGASVFCKHPLCCREEYGMPKPGEEAAGPWGGLGHCDIPANTLDHLLAQARDIVRPHIVYVTGDLPPHDIWKQTRDSNLASLNLTTSLLKKHFPDIPVLPALGNHESIPVNSYPVPSVYEDGYNNTWLYDNLALQWSYWLPVEALSDVRRGGFYVVMPFPGLRVISVNMNYCGIGNIWLLIDNVDPVDEMKWLVYQLTEAENMGDKVHILGHIPVGDTCDKTWSHVFNTIVTRFESTIRAIFFGHTHDDEWEVMYDVNNATRPVGISFITPAATTFSFKSPSFRVYNVDGGYDQATWAVTDHTTYSMNITEANANNQEPIYQVRYKAGEAYSVTGLSPASMDDLVTRMATNDTLFHTYLRHRFTYAEEPAEVSACTTACRKALLCRLVTGDSSDDRPCQRIKDIIDGNQ